MFWCCPKGNPANEPFSLLQKTVTQSSSSFWTWHHEIAARGISGHPRDEGQQIGGLLRGVARSAFDAVGRRVQCRPRSQQHPAGSVWHQSRCQNTDGWRPRFLQRRQMQPPKFCGESGNVSAPLTSCLLACDVAQLCVFIVFCVCVCGSPRCCSHWRCSSGRPPWRLYWPQHKGPGWSSLSGQRMDS